MKKIAFFIIIAVISTPLFAQVTPEELFLLRTDTEARIVAGLAAADTREQKMVALDSIEQMIRDGRVRQDDEQISNVLRSLAGEGTFVVIRESGRRANNFPDIRRRAVELLGELGGEMAKDMLIYISEKENEPMVLSEAVFALGSIGLNENNESLLAIARVLHDNTRRAAPDNNLAIASLLAIEKIAVANNGFPAEPDIGFLYRAVMGVQTGNYNTNVRRWAENLLVTLIQF
ncbi:MAG: HEAT repeat domain-containing protein [Spirochaetaceae bacterium]|nr:HEAT repeat domain-containing protein [Spirochaetaceae bacterium]